MKKSFFDYLPSKISAKHKGLFFLGLLLFFLFRLQSYEWVQASTGQLEMQPFLNPGERVILYKHASPSDYKKGDVIYLKLKGESHYQFSRIIAIHRGKVSIRKGKLRTNGTEEKLSRAIFPQHLSRDFPDLKKNEIFFCQDNQKSHIKDSSVFGALNLNQIEIRGKVFIQLDQFFTEDSNSDSPTILVQ